MKRFFLILALACCASIVQAQSTSTVEIPASLAQSAWGSGCRTEILSFDYKDGRILTEKEITCYPHPMLVCMATDDSNCITRKRARETYGLGADGTLQLLKTEEATHVPAQAERWEYPSSGKVAKKKGRK
jgi:hypothetical protein